MWGCEFRKALSSFESYKVNHQEFVGEVEKGTSGVLKSLIRQMEFILLQQDGKIIPKVLVMRFSKQIMILGRPDVIREMTKLVPHILKVCSHQRQSGDPNRGETLFHDHSIYVTASTEEKKNIEIYSSTYFTQCLESIYYWSQWVPLDENNNQSIYSKGYKSLLERGVTFHSNSHYYKNSDTEKFRNTYQVEFFSEPSDELNTSCYSYDNDGRKNPGETSPNQRGETELSSVRKAIISVRKEASPFLKDFIKDTNIDHQQSSQRQHKLSESVTTQQIQTLKRQTQHQKKLHQKQVIDAWKHQKQITDLRKHYEDRINTISKDAGQINNKQLKLLKQNQVLQSDIKFYQQTIYELENKNMHYSTNCEIEAKCQQLQKQVITLTRLTRNLESQNHQQKLMLNENTQRIKIGERSLQQKQHLIVQKDKIISQLREQLDNFHRSNKYSEQRIRQLEAEVRSLWYSLKRDEKQLNSPQKQFSGYQVKQTESNDPLKTQMLTSKEKTAVLFDRNGKQSPYSQKSPICTQLYQYKKFQTLRESFRPSKQKYLRFARCALKRKDLLLKQQEFEIGIISEVVSLYEFKFMLHLTNMSQDLIQEVNLNTHSPSRMRTELSTKYIFSLLPQEQQKVVLKYEYEDILEPSYQPLILSVSFSKNSRLHEFSVLIPYCLFKALEIYAPSQTLPLLKALNKATTIYPSKNMVPNEQILSVYFPGIRRTSNNVCECELFQRELNFGANLRIQFLTTGELLLQICPFQVNCPPKQQELVLNDLMGFCEFVFRSDCRK